MHPPVFWHALQGGGRPLHFRFACLHGKHAVEFFLDLANVVDPVATGPRGPGAREGRCLPLFSVFISGDDAPPRAKER